MIYRGKNCAVLCVQIVEINIFFKLLNSREKVLCGNRGDDRAETGTPLSSRRWIRGSGCTWAHSTPVTVPGASSSR